MAAAVLLAYSAKPFSFPTLQDIQMHHSQERHHLASVMGGISMGIAALTCIGMGVYRMLEALAASDDKKQEVSAGRRQRMRYILDMRKSKSVTVQAAADCAVVAEADGNEWGLERHSDEVAVV